MTERKRMAKAAMRAVHEIRLAADDIDIVAATEVLRRLIGEDTSIDALAFVHPGTPIPKERARYSPRQKGFFTPGRTREAERDLLYAFRVAMNRRHAIGDTVAIVALFFVPTKQRKDVDNCMKLVMDAGTKARVWLDDSQVVAQASFLEIDPARPRTVVALCSYRNSLTRAPLLLAPDERNP